MSKVCIHFLEKTVRLLGLCLSRVGRGSLCFAARVLQWNVQEALSRTGSFGVAKYGIKARLGHLLSERGQVESPVGQFLCVQVAATGMTGHVGCSASRCC